MESPICTVLLISYNHAPYIAKCIDSILIQKTKYPFIIKIFDDASNDGTADIIKEYVKKYPDKIFAFIAKENQGAQTNAWNAWNSVKTKYCILTETDDFWCDENKLQMQISAMENHPNCSFCSTNNYYQVIKDDYLTFLDNTVQIKPTIYKNKTVITLDDVKKIPTGFYTHISTRLIRTAAIDLNSIRYLEAFLADFSQFLYLLTKGDMYWIDIPTTVYVKTGSGNWSSASASNRMNFIWRGFLELNLQTNGVIFEKICDQLIKITSYWLKLKQKRNNISSVSTNVKTVNKKINRFKQLRHLEILFD